MKPCFLLPALLLLALSVPAQRPANTSRLQVASDGHFLQTEDGRPFFWLGDTGWELFHRLTIEEIDTYLENRKAKGFNVVKAVVLAEFDGLRKPNRYGQLPLQNEDPAQPNELYFQLVDTTLKMALQKGLYIGLLPTWGDKVTQLWGVGPVVFNEGNAYTYGLFLGQRYKAYPNIVWVLGGDRPAVKDSLDYRPIWRAMARGIKEGTGGSALVTYHPSGGDYSTTQFLPQEPWLDIHMFQSGHGGGRDLPVWNVVARDRKTAPVKPTLDGEPNYEDHPVSPWPQWDTATGYYDDYDVRKQCYRSVFAGACGVTYGHHSIWQFYSPREAKVNHAKMYWTEAMDRPGAFQVGYLRRLMESRPLQHRVPDAALIVGGQGEKGERAEAIRGGDNSFAFIYLPAGKTVTVNASFIPSAKVVAWWFNPKDASVKKIGIRAKGSAMEFTPPTTGGGNDWVLVLDDASKGYPAPGK
jgi:hypothetical protein